MNPDLPTLVRWNELNDLFSSLYPLAIEDVIGNQIIARVNYKGSVFQIRPASPLKDYTGGHKFAVWGPPFINDFNNYSAQ